MRLDEAIMVALPRAGRRDRRLRSSLTILVSVIDVRMGFWMAGQRLWIGIGDRLAPLLSGWRASGAGAPRRIDVWRFV